MRIKKIEAGLAVGKNKWGRKSREEFQKSRDLRKVNRRKHEFILGMHKCDDPKSSG